MLSLPDFKEKQILFIKTERKTKDKIKFWNSNIKFTRDGKTINQVSCYKIFAVFIIGDLSITSEIIKKCGQYGISIHLLDYGLEEYASFAPESEGNYLLRSIQYQTNDENDLLISKNIVHNKAINQISQLTNCSFNSNKIIKAISNAKSNKELLGIEGSLSKIYFGRIFAKMDWKRRVPRARQDINNLLLDIGYFYLFNFIDAILRSYGFDTYKGFYHKLFFQRKSLACDIMEPFRVVIDRQLVKSFNLRQINIKDFSCKNGVWRIKPGRSVEYSTLFMNAILNRKEDIHGYVKGFYRFLLGKEKQMPFFTITKGIKK